RAVIGAAELVPERRPPRSNLPIGETRLGQRPWRRLASPGYGAAVSRGAPAPFPDRTTAASALSAPGTSKAGAPRPSCRKTDWWPPSPSRGDVPWELLLAVPREEPRRARRRQDG